MPAAPKRFSLPARSDRNEQLVVAAQGYRDGRRSRSVAEQIVGVSWRPSAPVTVVSKAAVKTTAVADNISRSRSGRDRVISNRSSRLGAGVDRQARRIDAIHAKQRAEGHRSLHQRPHGCILHLFGEAGRQRLRQSQKPYAAVGASGFFVPGLVTRSLIGQICGVTQPGVNVIVADGVPSKAGSRARRRGISWSRSAIRAMKALGQEAKTAMNDGRATDAGHEQPGNPIRRRQTPSGRISYASAGSVAALTVHGVVLNKHLWRHQLAGCLTSAVPLLLIS
jgi:hypothetical protein